ncbi:MAG TPA: response regulator [Trichocoleus sp.]
MLPEDQKRILGYFIEEAKDHLNTIEQGLLNLQATIEDSEMANEVFRAAHSVKGGAAMLGLESIQHTSHRLEDYFKVLKESPIKADRTLESMLLQVFDGLQEQLEQLQGPFGLTDDKAQEIMAGIEPIFDQVNQHLESLVKAAGTVPVAKRAVERAPVTVPAATPQPAAISHSETSALQLVFKSDVPAHLRTMLGLFKQADNATTRQALQDACQQLYRIGEQFELPTWCALIDTARRVVSNTQQTFRILAPLLIKDIKAGQDLVLANQADQITVSPAMLELLPLEPGAEFLEESLDALLEEALNESSAESDLTDLFATAEADQVDDLEVPDAASWFEQGIPASIEDTESVNLTDVNLADIFESLNVKGDPSSVEVQEPVPVRGTGPEVGTAELNSLADLFEGEVSEFDEIWEEEEIAEVSLNGIDSDPVNADFNGEFADLFLTDKTDTPLSNDDDFTSLFGNSFLEESQVDIAAESVSLEITPSTEVTPTTSESFDTKDLSGEELGESLESVLSDEEIGFVEERDEVKLNDFFDANPFSRAPSFFQADSAESGFESGLDDFFAADEDLQDFAETISQSSNGATSQILVEVLENSASTEKLGQESASTDFDLADDLWNEQAAEIIDDEESLSFDDLGIPEEVSAANADFTDTLGFEDLDFSSALDTSSSVESVFSQDSSSDELSEAFDLLSWNDDDNNASDFDADIALTGTDLDFDSDTVTNAALDGNAASLPLTETVLEPDGFDSWGFDFAADETLDESPVNSLDFDSLESDSLSKSGSDSDSTGATSPDTSILDFVLAPEDPSEAFDLGLDDEEVSDNGDTGLPFEEANNLVGNRIRSSTSLASAVEPPDLEINPEDDLWASMESDVQYAEGSARPAANLDLVDDFFEVSSVVPVATVETVLSEPSTADDFLAEVLTHPTPNKSLDESLTDSLMEPSIEADSTSDGAIAEEPILADLLEFADLDEFEALSDSESAFAEDGFLDLQDPAEFDSGAPRGDISFETNGTHVAAVNETAEVDLGFDDAAFGADFSWESASFETNETDIAAVSETTEADLAFDELDSLLNDDAFSSEPVTNTFAQSPVEVDDFSDLEALLDEEPAVVEETRLFSVPAVSSGITQSSPSGEDDEFEDLEKLLEEADQIGGSAPGSGLRRSQAAARRLPRRNNAPADQTMRVSVKHLDNLSNLVGELVVNRNSLEQDQERLRQFLDNLLFQVQQLNDVGQRLRDLYERSLLESSLISSRQAFHPIGGGNGGSSNSHATGVTFDALEMDRFTGFHTLSQEMIELIVRVRESSSDIAFTIESTDQITRQFRQVTTQLQEGLNKARMVPFAQTADRLPRAVRDISMKCGKEAKLVVEGRDTLIDKMILERLYDPMTHLVNNAITHGVETPEERAASGKSREGTITVRAFYQGNQTVIYIADDGAGINAEMVKQKALKKGLITSAEARTMSKLDVYELLFLPGFSTRDQADDFAGRGVGMDVVRTALSDIRGSITIDSEMGRGTSFTIRLPLTLSISKALSCVNNQARLAFPMDGVEDMFDAPRERIQVNDQGQSCILWRDTLLPFRPLSELLQFNRTLGRGRVYGGNQDEDIISIVVLRSANTFIALQVDQVIGEQEIVIKQLEGPVPKPTGIAGATVLGDGRVMPIADVLELIDLSMGRVRRDPAASLWSQPDEDLPAVEATPAQTEPTVLIVDDSITVRELLSMSFNKVGYRVEQARDGQEAWEKLRSGLPCDLVFCDIEMPRMDGLELLSRMQKDNALSQIPIAMLTSRGADRHRQMAVDLGAKGYFTKPYLEEMLLDAAQRMLNGENMVHHTRPSN